MAGRLVKDPLIEEIEKELDTYAVALEQRRAGLVPDVVVYEAEQVLLGTMLRWRTARRQG